MSDGGPKYEIIPWLMNESSFALSVKLAARKIDFS